MAQPGPQLTSAQQRALASVSAAATAQREQAQRTIDEIRKMSAIEPQQYAAFKTAIAKHAQVALHFHPDRMASAEGNVAEALLKQGLYRSQFETGISAGSVSACAGGARALWEQRLFAGAYDQATPSERPKYGALDLLRHPDGPSPRFGCCFFLLAPAVSQRCTYSYGDSYYGPSITGTFGAFDSILSALLRESFLDDRALGATNLRPPELIARLARELPLARHELPVRPQARSLDHYIEAQVHGEVALALARDVEMLVADPAFQGTAVGATLETLARRYRIALTWHAGFSLEVAAVPTDFRGDRMPALAARVAGDRRRFDAHAIGQAAVELKRDPGRWADLGSEAEVLQQLKLLWHVLLRFGDVENASSPRLD
ncbi:MAG: DUF3626 domain-containing protein [Deltaproteobacteria bacterium]|nr:DUF3626 domain-containing protein [Deltaproteobacteria bacterium]